jgi:hypothetical protein
VSIYLPAVCYGNYYDSSNSGRASFTDFTFNAIPTDGHLHKIAGSECTFAWKGWTDGMVSNIATRDDYPQPRQPPPHGNPYFVTSLPPPLSCYPRWWLVQTGCTW